MGEVQPVRSGERRRAELADFLRARRAAVTPEMVDLRATGRRRTPGLRREEVAELAGVGLSWYTWLEQGRDISPSVQVLEAVSRALRLTAGEHDHLLTLAGLGRGGTRGGSAQVDHELRDAVDRLAPHPAYLVDERFDVVAHNRAAELVMADLLSGPDASRNLLLWLFAGRGSWSGLEDQWSTTARANLRDFRSAHARHAGEPGFEDLLAELTATGEPFTTWWAEHDVQTMEPTHKVFSHAELGDLELVLVQSHLVDPPFRLRILVPADQHTRTVLAERFA